METMKTVVLTVCVLSFIISIADVLKPGEKFITQLKPVFSLVFISGIIAAAAKTAFDIDFPVSEDISQSEVYDHISEEMNRSVSHRIEENINTYTKELLSNSGISCEKITSEINISQDNRISINRIGYKGKSFDKAKGIIEDSYPDTEVIRIE